MRIEQCLPDGSIDYGQGVIGPSAQDIEFSKKPQSLPLKPFSGQKPITEVGAIAAAVTFSPGITGDISLVFESEGPNNQYCAINLSPGNFYGNDDPIGFSVDFLEPSNPDSEHRVILKGTYYGIENDDHTKYKTSELEEGVEIWSEKGYSTDEYNLEVKEKAVDLIFGDEGKSCSADFIIRSRKDVVVANADSIENLLNAFVKEYNNQPVEKNDSDNLNQCMDLVTAWADELGIPRDAVIGLLYAKNLYLTPKQSTKDYFDIIPYEEGSTPQIGDVVVFGEGIGGVAGHAAIANGSGNTDTFGAFSQNYPTGSNAHIETFNFDSVLGWLRPKGFGREPNPKPTEYISSEFVPSTPEEYVRYRIAELLLSSFRYSNSSGSLRGQFGLPRNQEERLKQALARGERIEDSISFSEVLIKPFDGHSSNPTLYVHDPNGDLYEWDITLLRGTIKDWKIDVYPDADIPEVRNQEYLKWQGGVKIEGVMKYGIVYLNAIGTLEDFNRWDKDIFNFSGFDKITNFGTMDRTGENQTGFPNTVYVYENGDVECGDDDGCSGASRLNDIFGFYNHAKEYGAYNGWFDYKP